MRVETIHFVAFLATLITIASAQIGIRSDPKCPTQCRDCPGGKFGPSYNLGYILAFQCHKCPDATCTPPAGCDVLEPVKPSDPIHTKVDYYKTIYCSNCLNGQYKNIGSLKSPYYQCNESKWDTYYCLPPIKPTCPFGAITKGACGAHITQYQKGEGAGKNKDGVDFMFDVTLFDGDGWLIGQMENFKLGTGQSLGIPAYGLKDLFYIQAPAKDSDPIPLWIGNQKWNTGTTGHNNDQKHPNPHNSKDGIYATINYDILTVDNAGQREIDTGFAC